ncbi:unnamed protein product [Peronospora belbahrii]|uniref:START domain-containing protein n=1 Tax=Peronospora belbahrii TaxID=622444 RepID=A0ABN8DAS9_9STRA|nr:unnamed protein product [Peronospora belbahrii]
MDGIVPISPFPSIHVEELFATCRVDENVTYTSTTPHLSENNATFHDEIADFVVENEQFLRDMDQVVFMESEGESDLMNTNKKEKNNEANQISTVWNPTNEHQAINLKTCGVQLSSPCSSTVSNTSCQSTLDGSLSSCMTDNDELEVEGPIYTEEKKNQKQNQKKEYELDEEMRECDRILMMHQGVLPSLMAPSKFSHIDSSLSEISMTTSMCGYTDDSIAPSPLYLMLDKTLSSDSETCGDDEETEEEVMEDEIDLLEKETKYLDAQVVFLQSRAKSRHPQRKRLKQRHPRGMKQPHLLAKSQEDNQLLHNLVAQQKVYQENFQAMLALAPVNDVRMALMTPMESYIHLGKDFDERRKTILSLREEKLDMTYNFIEHKAAGLDWNQPYQCSDMFEKFGKYYSVNFSISRHDGVSVFQVGRAIYEQIAGKDKVHDSMVGSTTVHEPLDAIKCNFMHQRIISSMNWKDENTEKMPDVESNTIFYCRFGDNLAVLTTDYIDQDELHPYDTSNCIRRDVCCGVVLSGHVDADGKKFVVMKRYLMIKFHMYPHKMSQEQHDRFFASMPKCHDVMKTLIVDRLQRNEADDYSCAGED